MLFINIHQGKEEGTIPLVLKSQSSKKHVKQINLQQQQGSTKLLLDYLENERKKVSHFLKEKIKDLGLKEEDLLKKASIG